MPIRSLHIIGSVQMGGAESFFLRLTAALAEEDPVGVVLRSRSPLLRRLSPAVECSLLGMRSGWDLWSRYRLGQIVRSFDADIVQTYMGRASRLTHLPRGRKPVHVARLGGYYKIRGYYDHATAWIGNTKGICDYLVREGLPATRVYHIGNFVNSVEPRPGVQQEARRQLGLPAEAIIIFSLGRFIAKKGFADLLQAFALLRQRSHAERPLMLVVGGNGPDQSALQKLMTEAGLSGHCRFSGWIDDPSCYFAAADLFVCPSREEPLGNVILEAWSHRLPVVTTATAASVELIKEGINGLVVPIGDPASMATVLDDLLKQPALAAELAQQGYGTQQSCHSKQAITGAYRDLYRLLLRS